MIVINWNTSIPFYEGHIFKPDNKESVLSIVLEFHLIYRWSFEGMLVNPSTSCKCVLRQISLTRDLFLQILTHTCKHLGEARFKSTLYEGTVQIATFEVKWAMKPIKLSSLLPDFLSIWNPNENTNKSDLRDKIVSS